MNQEYMEFVTNSVRTPRNPATGSNVQDRLMLGAIGLAGEAGEVLEIHKKYLFHGKPLDRDRVAEEMGDVLWYYTLLLQHYSFNLEEDIIKPNMAKLIKRNNLTPEGKFKNGLNY